MGSMRVYGKDTPNTGRVTFHEIVDIHDGGGPKDGGTKKLVKTKSKVNIENLDVEMEKLNIKIAQRRHLDLDSSSIASTSLGTSKRPIHAWEVDPSLLNIESLIGKGTYGSVYKATYNNKVVAVKMLEWGAPGSMDLDDQTLSKQFHFLREVEIMYKLEDHRNVCTFYGASVGSMNFHLPSPLGGSVVPVNKMMCCIIMEFMSGGSLRSFWISHRRSGKRRMPFNVMIQFSLDIARGVAHLHSKKICHRDLKPDNMLLDSNSYIKLADFGISRVEPERLDEMTTYTGTPNYTAPEILEGLPYNHKCDVYSFGICMWEIYTCDVPYPDMYDMQSGKVNQAIIKKNFRPRIPMCCPGEFKSIMTKCWDTDPQRRPEMAQVVQWLEAINTDRIRWITNDNVVEGCACITECCHIMC